jgi:RHS repeat-associated protein
VGAAGGAAQINWLVTDHLGTPRMIADQTGSLAGIKRHDYLPFGEEIGAGVGGRTTGQGYVADNVRQGFTGYEKDDETGLNFAQARYFASTQGRFTSVDPALESGRPSLPQTWNRYAYVLNNPLKYVDPNGEEWKFVGNKEASEEELRKAFEAAVKAKGKDAWKAYQAIDKAKGTITVSLENLGAKQFGETNVSFSYKPQKDGTATLTGVSGTVVIGTNPKAIDTSNFTDLVTASSHEYNHVLSVFAKQNVQGIGKQAPPDQRTGKDKARDLSDFRVEAAAYRAQVHAEEVTRSQDNNRPVSPNTALGGVTKGVAGTKSNRELYDYLTKEAGLKFKQSRP